MEVRSEGDTFKPRIGVRVGEFTGAGLQSGIGKFSSKRTPPTSLPAGSSRGGLQGTLDNAGATSDASRSLATNSDAPLNQGRFTDALSQRQSGDQEAYLSPQDRRGSPRAGFSRWRIQCGGDLTRRLNRSSKTRNFGDRADSAGFSVSGSAQKNALTDLTERAPSCMGLKTWGAKSVPRLPIISESRDKFQRKVWISAFMRQLAKRRALVGGKPQKHER